MAVESSLFKDRLDDVDDGFFLTIDRINRDYIFQELECFFIGHGVPTFYG
ncbi:hypothetical protein ACWOBE_07125 [Hutsoniella sourekii]